MTLTNWLNRALLLTFLVFFLSACGGGSTSSGIKYLAIQCVSASLVNKLVVFKNDCPFDANIKELTSGSNTFLIKSGDTKAVPGTLVPIFGACQVPAKPQQKGSSNSFKCVK